MGQVAAVEKRGAVSPGSLGRGRALRWLNQPLGLMLFMRSACSQERSSETQLKF